MKTTVVGSLKVEIIPGDARFVRTTAPLKFYSTTIGQWGEIPTGFVMDYESVPLFKGTNPEAGAIHDYYSRTDSQPVVSKKIAAKIYEEFQSYYDAHEKAKSPVFRLLNRVFDWIRRKGKTATVRVWPRYFHKHKVSATYATIAGIDEEDSENEATDNGIVNHDDDLALRLRQPDL